MSGASAEPTLTALVGSHRDDQKTPLTRSVDIVVDIRLDVHNTAAQVYRVRLRLAR